MKLSNTVSAVIAAALLIAAPALKAVEIPLNGQWIDLVEQKNAAGNWEFAGNWTWDSTEYVQLCLTDVYVPGDVFEVYDQGKLLGQTRRFNPNLSGAFAETPDEAIVDEAFSHACWLLDPGFHSITVRTIAKPSLYANDESYAGLRVQTKNVPEGGPGVVLLGMALAGLAGLRRLRVARRGAGSAC